MKTPDKQILVPTGEPISGVYIIENLINHKKYVGSSGDCRDRLVHERNSLKRGTHHSSHLQSAWNKYGSQNFVMYVAIKLEESEDGWNILAEEDTLIYEFQTKNHKQFGYNDKYATKPSPSEETKEKISEALRGRKYTKEHKENISKAKIELHQDKDVIKMYSQSHQRKYINQYKPFLLNKLNKLNDFARIEPFVVAY